MRGSWLRDLPGRIRRFTVRILPLVLAGCETTGPAYRVEAQCFFDGTCGLTPGEAVLLDQGTAALAPGEIYPASTFVTFVGIVEVVVDWTDARSDLLVSLSTVVINNPSSPVASVGSLAAGKPLRLVISASQRGTYILEILNRSPHPESIAFRVLATPRL
jgi:hypothetical protein